MSATLPGCWDGLVVIAAGTSWDGIWFPEKHLAHRLAEYAPVLYVDPPASAIRRDHRGEAPLRLIRPGLARLTPRALPGMHRAGIQHVTEALVRRALRRAARALTRDVRAVVVAAPDNLFGVCGEAEKILYATDDFVAGAELMGVPVRRLQRSEAIHASSVDKVVAISTVLVDKWRALGHEPVFIPNGCDDEMFASTDQAPLPPGLDLPGPVAGFIGHLSHRIDIALLEAVAERGRSLLLVGPVQRTFESTRMDALLERPNVTSVGAQPFESLPSYLRLIDVGLTPYGDSPFNRASLPLKTLEYLAGGRAVVATDLPAVRWLDTDLVRIAPHSPREYADAVDIELGAERTPGIIARRQAFAAEHGWAARTASFAGVLGLEASSDRRANTGEGNGLHAMPTKKTGSVLPGGEGSRL